MIAYYYTLVVVADCKDGVEDAGSSNVAETNSTLLSLLNDRLKGIHDIELPLCSHDTVHIAKLLFARNSDHTDCVLPPCVPTRFRCYVRLLTSSHVILTVVPATYDDMVAVMSMLDSVGSVVDLAASSAATLSEDKKVEAAADTVNYGGISADRDLNVSKNVEETFDDPNNSSCQVNGEEDTLMHSADAARDETATTSPRNICLPVFVFDCMLNLVKNQLVHHSDSERPADIVEDFTYPVVAS